MALEISFLFQGIGDQANAAIARIAVDEVHQAGDFLFKAGDPADCLYILQEGRVRLSVRGTGHIAQIVSEPGDALGWSSMVENDNYTASAECLLPVRVLKLDRDKLMRVLEADPAAGMLFFRRLSQLIARRLVASYGATLSVHGQRDPRSWG